MIWRPWIVSALLILAGVVNAMLLLKEQIPTIEKTPELVKSQEILKIISYLPNSRRANFTDVMGLRPELADAAANQISRYDRQGERFARLLEDQAAELVDVFCPSERLPQPYAALSYLVEEENGIRRVVDATTLVRFERQAWYDRSLVPALYDRFERTESRKQEATVMAVSAALLGREADALDGVSPWSQSLMGSWGFSRLESREPRISRLVVEYFALMHYLTELANSPRGICA